MKNFKNYSLGTITSYLSNIINIVINILLIPIFMKNLGNNSYGIWITLSSIFGAMSIADLGMGQSVSKLISEYSFDKNKQIKIKKIISTAFYISLILSCFLLFINIIISFYISTFMNVFNNKIQILYLLLCINFIINFVFSIFNNILIGYKKIYLSNIIGILRSIITFIINYILLIFIKNLNTIALSYICISLLMSCLAFSYIKKIIPGKIISYKYYDKNTIKLIFKPGIYYFIIQIAGLIVYNTDNIVLSHFTNVTVVALYATAYKIIDVFMKFIFILIDNLFPFISELDGKKQYKVLKKMNILTSKISISMGIFLSFMYYSFSKNIIDLWVGKNNFIGYKIIFAFCIILLINSSTHNSSVYINALYKQKNIAYLSFFEGSFNLIFSLIFVKFFGPLGVAIGTCFAALLTSAWYVPAYCCNILHIKVIDYLKKVINKNIIIAVIFFIILLIEKLCFIKIDTIFSLIVIFALNWIIFLLISYMILYNNDERKLLYIKIKNLIVKLV